MAEIIYDKDINQEKIKELNVSVIGFGSQGHAHALNLKDSGVGVVVGLRENSSSWQRAEDQGLKVMQVKEATEDADVVMLLGRRREEAFGGEQNMGNQNDTSDLVKL